MASAPPIKYFTSSSEMTKTDNVSAGIIFRFDSSNNYSYAIRLPFNDIADTTAYYKGLEQCRDGSGADNSASSCAANTYLNKGFTLLQTAINTALLRDFSGNAAAAYPDISVQMMPKDKYQPSTSYIQILSAIYFVMAYAPFISFLCALLVVEKEKKIKEGMQMMGLNEVAHSMAIGVIYSVMIAGVTVIVTIIAVVSKFFENSNVFIFYIILLLFGLSLISLAYVMAPFFTKANTAGGVSSLGTMVISCLYLIVSMTRTTSSTGELSYTIPPVGRGFLCLLSPVAVALAMDQAIYLDITGGMNFETVADGEFPLYIPILMLVVDIVLYGLLARYLENVLPGQYGARHKPWFIFMPSYWCGKKDHSQKHFDDTTTFFGNDIEDVPSDLKEKSAVRIFNLVKEFKTKEETVKAVNGLSLEIYEGQITCLLGHNGAGKTTLINMLSGLMQPTKGNASVLGYDICNQDDIHEMRRSTGVCPQHNILHDLLTCVEHLVMYGAIKGVPPDSIDKMVDEALDHVGLADQKNKYAKDLSGGQKRKLSVAIAIIGDPKIIFLDEPTAGMDPYSRRHLWSVLKEKKKGRVILLTTHFMDEADILADRKAIISKGRLRCCGSSLFLKNKFGIGYHLNMVVEPACDRDGVTEFIQGIIPGSNMQRTHGKELAYTLPLDKVSNFSDLFTELEKQSTSVSTHAEAMGIKSYGVSMTTLEEVFLKLEEDDAITDLHELVTANDNYESKKKSNSLSIHDNGDTTIHLPEIETNTDKFLNVPRSEENLKLRQFKAMCRLKALKLWRNKPLLVINLFVPVILVVVGLVVSQISTNTGPDNSDPTPLNMDTAIYTYSGSATSGLPALYLRDSAGSTYSASWTTRVRSMFKNETYSNTTNFLAAGTHYLGIDVQKMQDTTPPTNVIQSSWALLYNTTAAHSIPVLVNLLSNGLLYGYSAITGNNVTSQIAGYSKPWPAEKKLEYNQSAFSAVILLGVGLLVIAPGFAVDLVIDRERKARCQLRVSGVTQTVYWLSNFCVDIAKFLVTGVLILILALAMQLDSLKNGGAILSLILIFVTYMPAVTLYSYMWSFAFKKFETCQAFLTTIFFFFGFMPGIAVMLVDLIAGGDTGRILHIVLGILDTPYLVFGALYYIDKAYRVSKLTNVDVAFGDYFKWDSNIPITYIIALIHIPVLLFIVRLLDIKVTGGDMKDATNCLGKNKVSEDMQYKRNTDKIEDEDDDVAEERGRVTSLHNKAHDQPPVILVEELRKEYVKDSKQAGCCGRDSKCRKLEGRLYPAVRNATFAVDAGEVFGLLGPNGAGKTTTLNMVIAEQSPTKGKVMIAGHNIRSAASDAYTCMGYCPQHDALWDMLTLQEHLEIYAAIQGIPSDQIRPVVEWFMESLKIDEHKKKFAKNLSGGTKRKLSYSISMLGNPKAVLLDEPSTGMDPQSKRFLWDTISLSFSGSERGAILTTHYMEEADALCTRIAIMVNGKMECIGASQHLKYKFGSGYLLEVKLRHYSHLSDEQVAEQMTSLEGYVLQLFPDAVLLEKFDERAQYKVPKNNVKSLAQAFTALESAKQSHSVEEYSFSQSTLEQVFLEFAKRQKEEGELHDNPEENTPYPSPLRSSINSPTHRPASPTQENIVSVKL
ncbi:hypothetical protein FSP39_024134 [Pinctada imbricata]|uniref:ABC transporter domain-containing protein n=1 Tax=Pinctada imbricata TaxID=66713 RepID=A0AA89BQT6_PINIB|nr:hypothetical protein FSP39_024134 [Pinctada imbricata]